MPNHLRLPKLLAFVAVLASASAAAETDEFIRVLQNTRSTLYEKARACQRLGEVGSEAAVPALVPLLTDDALNAYARSALEGIPGTAGAAALRSALPRLKGNQLTGVINSLGVLRDEQATDALAALTRNADPGIASASLLALGRIASDNAIAVVRRMLTAESAELRAAAGSAALIAAQLRLAGGDAHAAVSLNDAVLKANVPETIRLAATKGAIVSRKDDGIPLLARSLRSDDRSLRNMALVSVRGMASPARLVETLTDVLEHAGPELQAQLVEALAETREPRAMLAVRARAESASPLVREAVVRALGNAGDSADADLLLRRLMKSGGSSETDAAATALSRLRSPAVDAMVVRELGGAKDKATRLALIRILDERSPASGATVLLQQAADKDPEIRLAALEAMRSLAGTEHLPRLIALTKTFQDGRSRAAAESTVAYAVTRESASTAVDLLLAELERSTEPLDRASWIRGLAAAGSDKALPAVLRTLSDPNTWLVNVTLDQLGKWPDAAPVSGLLNFAASQSAPALRSKALTTAVALAAAAGNARSVPAAEVTGWFRRADTVAVSLEDKKAVIGALGRWTDPASIRLLLPRLKDPQLRADAAVAITAAAAPVAEGPDYAMLKPVLEELAAIDSEGLKDRISLLRRSMAATESAKE